MANSNHIKGYDKDNFMVKPKTSRIFRRKEKYDMFRKNTKNILHIETLYAKLNFKRIILLQ